MRRILLGLALLAASAAVTAVPACAQIAAPTESGFQTYLQTLRGQAERAGISGRTIAAVFPTLTLSQRVIELDRAQPGGSSNPNAIPHSRRTSGGTSTRNSSPAAARAIRDCARDLPTSSAAMASRPR
jgi:membrane-bound lytic murein transglycosylase B